MYSFLLINFLFCFLFLQIILLSLIHISGSYNFENFRAKGFLCKTNIPSSTAIRGFGGPQSVFIIENIVNDVAVYLKKDKAQVNKSQAESRPPLKCSIYQEVFLFWIQSVFIIENIVNDLAVYLNKDRAQVKGSEYTLHLKRQIILLTKDIL